MKLYIADAFTDTVFGGNPAGVAILEEGSDFPDSEKMRKIAAELRYSETAFIKPLNLLDDGTCDLFQIRYFTPADEVDLCGHATIASFHCLKEAGLVKPGQKVVNETLAGDLNIEINSDSILMDMATPEFLQEITCPEALGQLYGVMGLDWKENITALMEQCARNGGDGSGLKPEIISTGLPDIIMPVATREELEAINPDFKALADLSRDYDVTGVHAFTLDGGKHRGGEADVTAYCRNFAPLYDIDEEAATGTANGALTYYLIRNGLEDPALPEGSSCRFIQGEAMDRPSLITSHAKVSSKGEQPAIKVGGKAVILVEGHLF